MEKVGGIMEKLWLVIIFISIAYISYIFFNQGIDKENWQIIVIPGIAIFWYFVRKRLRKRIEGNIKDEAKK